MCTEVLCLYNLWLSRLPKSLDLLKECPKSWECGVHSFNFLRFRHADHFQALARLIELNRRSGQLEACEPFINQVCMHSIAQVYNVSHWTMVAIGINLMKDI